MKLPVPLLLATLGLASFAFAQSPSPASSPAAAPSSTAGRTDLYHVHFAKAAAGKASEEADALKKQDPAAPMQGHVIVLRHQQGDSWDYCAIEHLGTKATVEANRPAPPASEMALGEWHNDTYANGPSWTEFAKQMGLDDASKSTASVYTVSIYRPVPGQREALDKFLNEPPDRATDSSSGNVVLQHLEGAAWTFVAITRYNSWADYAKTQVAQIAEMAKSKDSGWNKLRTLAAFHTDTACDRIAP